MITKSRPIPTNIDPGQWPILRITPEIREKADSIRKSRLKITDEPVYIPNGENPNRSLGELGALVFAGWLELCGVPGYDRVWIREHSPFRPDFTFLDTSMRIRTTQRDLDRFGPSWRVGIPKRRTTDSRAMLRAFVVVEEGKLPEIAAIVGVISHGELMDLAEQVKVGEVMPGAGVILPGGGGMWDIPVGYCYPPCDWIAGRWPEAKGICP